MMESITVANVALPTRDVFALLWFFVCSVGYTWYAELVSVKKRSLLNVMNQYRLQWMRQMLKRDNRMVDSTAVGNLLRSIAFFASSTILIVAGTISMMNYRDHAIEIISTLPFAVENQKQVWEIKTILLTMIFVYAFFKYTWSLRQYNYACIMIGAAPMPNEKLEQHEAYAQRAAGLIGNAARHFNMGLRAYYFGMAALSWFIHPWLLVVVTTWVVVVLYRREFRSKTLDFIAAH
ncbi:MAG: DUF599 domain-containing protein [Alphaproteobacteria bacterium]|nr:DUF599 domain-containing protein [Alphaproteobacteria bacterium]